MSTSVTSVPQRFAGFDTSTYPGDGTMQLWKSASPYQFTGYYLKAPCHSSPSWLGKRSILKAMGWGMAVIYLGRQMEGPCSAHPVSAPLGQSDAADAIGKCRIEAFPDNTVIFLDVEPMGLIPDEMKEYVLAWFQSVTASPFVAGMYCHVKNAAELRSLVLAGYPAGKPQPLFWVAGGTHHFDPGTSVPADSGIQFASLWQGRLDTQDAHGGVQLQIDMNVSNFPDPSGTYIGLPQVAEVDPASTSADGTDTADTAGVNPSSNESTDEQSEVIEA